MEKLNKEQFEAVTYKNGPLLIIAGAGTGKTTVITQKIAWLIEQGFAKTDEILALTFTEKAAGEMEERVDRLLPLGYLDLWISTFHSFCERILKNEGLAIGLTVDFKLINSFQQWALIKKNLDRFSLDYYRPLGNPTKFIHSLLRHFSRAKDEVISPEDYLKYAEGLKINLDNMEAMGGAEIAEQEILRINEVAGAYHTYQQLLLENSYLDFGDLINYCLKLFEKRPGILKKYREQFKYILVDEFQDTNWAQYELVKMLAAPKNNLTVVADDDQSIFRFRGASMSNILQFKKDYPKSKNVVLINNYRSRQNILDLAYEFIKLNNPNRLEEQLKNNKNEEKLDKKLRSQIKGSGTIECISEKTLDDEVKKVVSKIIELKNSDIETTWNDFAILIRANNMANSFIPILERAEIPFIFLASKGLYSKPIIMDIIAYLKLLDDYHESAAVYRILSIPIFDFSNKEISLFNYWARRRAWSLYETLKNAAVLGFKKEAIEKISKVLNLVEKHTQSAKTKTVGEIILKFLNNSGYLKYIMRQDEQKMRENTNYLNQFYRKIQNFERENGERLVKNFLAELQMEVESGEEGSLVPDYDSGPEEVKILTAHAAKGLEFQYIFIVNLADRRFPTTERKEAILLPDDLIKEILPEGDIHLEEERRLFYVAMTRAKKGLFFSWAEDCGGVRKKKPSRFLAEIGMVNEKKLSEAASGLQILSSPLAKSETKEKTAINSFPPHFSFSQLAAFSSCPYQYYLGFILKVPTQGKSSFSFGKTMHSTFQRIAELIIANQSNAQKSLFDSNQRLKKFSEMISLEEMLDIFKASWIDDWYEDKNSKEKHLQKGKKVIKEFYNKFRDEILQPLYLEKMFKIKIAGYVIRGAIDRVDKTEGGLKIIDYKTGEPKEKLTFENKKQLIIYQLAGEQLFDEPIKKLSFYYLNNNSEVEFLGKDKELKKVEKWIADTIEKIKQNDFAANPGNLCQWCDFKDICEFKK